MKQRVALKFCLEIVYEGPSRKIAYNGQGDFSSDQLRKKERFRTSDGLIAQAQMQCRAKAGLYGLFRFSLPYPCYFRSH
jgi:hypothetical protein